MSHTQGAARGPEDTRNIEEHYITSLHGDESERTDERGRRWHDLRPEPRRRTDLMGFNYTWWITVVWVIVIALIVFPFPWW